MAEVLEQMLNRGSLVLTVEPFDHLRDRERRRRVFEERSHVQQRVSHRGIPFLLVDQLLPKCYRDVRRAVDEGRTLRGFGARAGAPEALANSDGRLRGALRPVRTLESPPIPRTERTPPMTLFLVAALNALFATALLGAWGYMMASARHLKVPARAAAAPAEHVLRLDARRPHGVAEVAASAA